MDGSQLNVVGVDFGETVGTRLRRLRQELRAAAADEISTLEDAMYCLSQVAREIVEARDAFPPGVSEICRGLIEDLDVKRKSIGLIMSRAD